LIIGDEFDEGRKFKFIQTKFHVEQFYTASLININMTTTIRD